MTQPHPAVPDMVAFARTMIGTPFRFKGRHRESGVDCLGLVMLSAAGAGLTLSLPSGYALRQRDFGDTDSIARSSGLVANPGKPQPGDIAVFAVSSTQRHLAIADECDLFIHAHAGLGRVVRGPIAPDWLLLSCWRLADSKHPVR